MYKKYLNKIIPVYNLNYEQRERLAEYLENIGFRWYSERNGGFNTTEQVYYVELLINKYVPYMNRWYVDFSYPSDNTIITYDDIFNIVPEKLFKF